MIEKPYNKTLGFTTFGIEERQKDDFYATDPIAVELLLDLEKFEGSIWECACGQGHLSKKMKEMGYSVWSTDIVDRGYGDEIIDFLEYNKKYDGNIITNPPYKYGNEFIKQAMLILEKGKKLALFLPIRYLEGKERKELYKKYPPKTIYVSSSRLNIAKNGDFDRYSSSTIGLAWFVWEKGYEGETILKWFN